MHAARPIGLTGQIRLRRAVMRPIARRMIGTECYIQSHREACLSHFTGPGEADFTLDVNYYHFLITCRDRRRDIEAARTALLLHYHGAE